MITRVRQGQHLSRARAHAGRRYRGVSLLVVGALVAAGAGVVAQPLAAHAAPPAANDFSYVALPDNFFPLVILDDGTALSPNTGKPPLVWQHGVVTALGAPTPPAGGAPDPRYATINASGTVVGQVEFDHEGTATTQREGEVWQPSGYTNPPTTFPLTDTTMPTPDGYGATETTQDFAGQNDFGQLALDTSSTPGGASPFGQITDANGANPRTVPGVTGVGPLGNISFLGVTQAGTSVVGDLTTFAVTPLDFTANGMSPNGWITGRTTSDTLVLRSPAGLETTLPYHGGTIGVDNNGDVLGLDTDNNAAVYVPHGATTATPVTDLLPAGSAPASADGISPNGIIGGHTKTSQDGTTGFELVPSGGRLTAAITVTDANGNALTGASSAKGKTAVATVTLTASGMAPEPITGVTATLAANAGGKLKQTSSTGPPSGGYTLQPGQSVSYQVSYTITGTGGVTLTVSATGTEGGVEQDATAEQKVLLTQPLQVDVAFRQNGLPIQLALPGKQPQPDTIQLDDGDNGELPQDVQAVVTLTNSSSQTQTNIAMNGVPALSYHNPSQATKVQAVGVTAGPGVRLPNGQPGPSTAVKDLAPGATAQVTYTVRVTDNGVFDFTPQAISSDHDDTNSVSQGVGTLTAVPKHLLVLSVKLTQKSVRAGAVATVTGTLTNRSNTQTLDVDPLEPVDVTGNVGGGRLVDDTSAGNVTLGLLADGVQIPFFGDLKPGQQVQLTGKLSTTYVPGTRGQLSYEPHGSVKNDDGSETELITDQIKLTSGSSPLNVSIDTSDPVVPTASGREVVENFTDGAVQGAAVWADGEMRGGLNLLAHPIDGAGGAITGLAKMVYHAPENVTSAAYLLGEVQLYAAVWAVLTPAQRGAFEKGIIDDFNTSGVKANNPEMAASIASGMDSFEGASYRGDYAKLANLAGHGLASGGGLVADYLLTDVFFQKLSLGLKATVRAGKAAVTGELASALVLADELKNAKLPAAALNTVKDVKAGQNLLASNAKALTGMWGMTSKQVADLTEFCNKNGIIVAVRQRSARAAQLIERGLAIGKNEVLKLKGVNEIDWKYLGYKSTDLNQLVFAEPIPLSELLPKLRGLSKAVRDVIMERYDTRLEEWSSPKVRNVMEKADKAGEIDWGFNGKDNGAPAADKLVKRRFHLYERKGVTMLDGTTPRVYQEVYVGNKPGLGGKLVRVTQASTWRRCCPPTGKSCHRPFAPSSMSTSPTYSASSTPRRSAGSTSANSTRPSRRFSRASSKNFDGCCQAAGKCSRSSAPTGQCVPGSSTRRPASTTPKRAVDASSSTAATTTLTRKPSPESRSP